MINHNLLNQIETHLDYGCGKGSDVRILNEKGYQSVGYDPYYFPDYPTKKADVVTCGYVLNVLTQRCDRLTVVKKCWELTNFRLIVAAQTGTDMNLSLIELRAIIEVATKRRAIALAKGMFLVNKHGVEIETFTKDEVIEKCDRLPEIERDLQQHYSKIDINVLGTWQHRGNVELYFKHRYKKFNHRIGKLTEYYRFKNADAVLDDLCSMQPKTLSEAELKILQDKTKAIV